MWRGTSLVLVGARSSGNIRVGQAWCLCRGSRGKTSVGTRGRTPRCLKNIGYRQASILQQFVEHTGIQGESSEINLDNWAVVCEKGEGEEGYCLG